MCSSPQHGLPCQPASRCHILLALHVAYLCILPPPIATQPRLKSDTTRQPTQNLSVDDECVYVTSRYATMAHGCSLFRFCYCRFRRKALEMPVVKYLLASFDANTLIVSTTVLQQTFVTIINLGDDISLCNVTVFHSSSMNDHNYRLIDRRT